MIQTRMHFHFGHCRPMLFVAFSPDPGTGLRRNGASLKGRCRCPDRWSPDPEPPLVEATNSVGRFAATNNCRRVHKGTIKFTAPRPTQNEHWPASQAVVFAYRHVRKADLVSSIGG